MQIVSTRELFASPCPEGDYAPRFIYGQVIGARRPRTRQDLYERHCMGLFNAETYRSFALGFGFGTLVLAIVVGTQMVLA